MAIWANINMGSHLTALAQFELQSQDLVCLTKCYKVNVYTTRCHSNGHLAPSQKGHVLVLISVPFNCYFYDYIKTFPQGLVFGRVTWKTNKGNGRHRSWIIYDQRSCFISVFYCDQQHCPIGLEMLIGKTKLRRCCYVHRMSKES